MNEARRLGDILGGRLGRLEASGEVRAYRAWQEAAGGQIRAVTTPARLTGDTLLVECESSVWAQELTYLGPRLLARMQEVDPETPVRRLRFVMRSSRH